MATLGNITQMERRIASWEVRADELDAKIRDLKIELMHARTDVKKGTWLSLSDDVVSIAFMDSQHLLSAIAVCERFDPRYEFDAARMKSFSDMVREAIARGLAW